MQFIMSGSIFNLLLMLRGKTYLNIAIFALADGGN